MTAKQLLDYYSNRMGWTPQEELELVKDYLDFSSSVNFEDLSQSELLTVIDNEFLDNFNNYLGKIADEQADELDL